MLRNLLGDLRSLWKVRAVETSNHDVCPCRGTDIKQAVCMKSTAAGGMTRAVDMPRGVLMAMLSLGATFTN
jgi:hypothetical protein